MNLEFTKEQAERMVGLYYKKYEGSEVEVSSKASSSCTGIHEIPCTDVKFTVSQEVDFFGEKIKSEITLSEKDIDHIFKTLLEEEGYQVNCVSYDAVTTTGDFFYRGTRSCLHSIKVSVSREVSKKPKCLVRPMGV